VRIAISDPARILSLLASAAVACGGGKGGDSLYVGSDDGDDAAFVATDANAASAEPLDAHFQEHQVTVTFVTLHCAGDCADVQAIASGGNPPYSYAWDDGPAGAARHLCPASNTTYRVKVTDAGRSGEFPQPPSTVSVPLPAYVLACTDGGPPADGCDSVTNVSPSGANPYRAWSYGWSSSLGATFTLHTEFLPAASGYGGNDAWTSGLAGVELNPASYFNPTTSPIRLSTLTAQPGQFFLHPGPIGQYSIARWTTPRAGTYVVRATFEGIDIGPTTTDVHIQHDGTDVATGYINVNGGGNTYQASPSVSVSAGDTIDFAVGYGNGGYNNDSTALSATVCNGSGVDGG
jgi:hypothetical protein